MTASSSPMRPAASRAVARTRTRCPGEATSGSVTVMPYGVAVWGSRTAPSTTKVTAVTPMSSDTRAVMRTSCPGSARAGASSVITGGRRSPPSPGTTVTTSVSLPTSSPSLAVNSRTYRPGMPNDAVVVALPGAAKATGDGPSTDDHVMASAAPPGRPSSVTTPASGSGVPITTRASVPASTRGTVFSGGAGSTTTLTTAAAVNSPSLAVARSS